MVPAGQTLLASHEHLSHGGPSSPGSVRVASAVMPERTAPTSPRGFPPRLSLPELWAVLAVVLPILGALLATISTVDLAYHLRAGAIVLDQRTLPSPDTFTFTAGGLPWFDQQWAAQVAFAALFRAGGWGLLAVVRALLVGLVAWLVFRACRWAGAETRVAAWLTLSGFVVGLVALGLRPQLLGMVMFAATLAILAARGRRPGLVWAIPLIIIAWSNVHGSFFLGPAAVVVAWLEDVAGDRPGARRLLGVAVVSLGATVVNPYGTAVWSYAFGLAANPTIRRLISEWQVTSPLSFIGVLFYGSIAAVVAVVVVSIWRRTGGSSATRLFLRRTWPTLLWMVGLVAIGAIAERGVAWWSIAAPVAVARLLYLPAAVRANDPDAIESASASLAVRRSLVPTGIVAVLLVAIVALLPFWRAGDPLYGPSGLLAEAPRGITDAVLAVARPGDRIWNAERWGSWLELAVPAATVAVDSRIEFIPTDAWEDHLALSGGAADWSAILDRRGVSIVVASSTEQESLIPLLRSSSSWTSTFEGPDGVVFVRDPR